MGILQIYNLNREYEIRVHIQILFYLKPILL